MLARGEAPSEALVRSGACRFALSGETATFGLYNESMARAVPLSGKRVLIVEDNFLIAQDLRDVLRAAGCKVCGTVATSAAALALLADKRLDGVLLDVGLADTDACSVAMALDVRGVPFLLVTGYEHRELPLTLRGRPCLSKPYSIDRLVAMASRAFAN